MVKILFIATTGVTVFLGASCSQLPGPATSDRDSAAAFATTKKSDAIQQGSSDAESKTDSEPSAPDAKPTTETTVQPTVAPSKCNDPSAVRTETITITVPRNLPASGGKACPYGMGDNRDRLSGTRYAARLEFSHPILIPVDREVCSINPSANTQRNEYGEHIFLNLNNLVLIGSRGIPSEFELDASGFRKYDWSKIVGTDRASNVRCGAGVTCQVPRSDRLADFSFSLSQEARTKLLASLANRALQFTVVVTGDDDAGSDCKLRNDLVLTFNYTYAPK